jgi:hypothetical protein
MKSSYESKPFMHYFYVAQRAVNMWGKTVLLPVRMFRLMGRLRNCKHNSMQGQGRRQSNLSTTKTLECATARTQSYIPLLL